ncbi:MAG: hypothetical protein E7401_06220 [Ruminococcaceae bacterium]|nr:hypothetical protein [Oscillospiraceae bacterium]
MKKYRAVVIDGKKLIRRGIAVMTLAVVAALGVLDIKIAAPKINVMPDSIGQSAVAESVPVIGAVSGTAEKLKSSAIAVVKKVVSFVLTFDPFDLHTAVAEELPLIKAVGYGYLARTANQSIAAYNPQNVDTGGGTAEPATPGTGQYPITEVDSGQGKALGKEKSKILIRNETDFGINIDEMLSSPLKFDMKGEEPKVLIVHTHTTECYSPEGASVYSADKSDRSLNADENMTAVGKAVKRVFEKKGIKVIHDATVHDNPSFNGSYENSRKTVEKYKAKYPGIAVVLDLHRDAFIYDDGSKAKFVTEIDGKKTAQLMLVVGTNGGGLDHPNWRENMKLALKLQNHISKKYPSLMRGVNLRKERFNGHVALGSMIIEVGSSGNTLSEAVRGAELAAAEISDFLNTLK